MMIIFKYYTKINLIVAFISILIGALLKFYLLPFTFAYLSLDPSNMQLYFISGGLVAVIRLALRGIIEAFFIEYLPETMSMNTGGSYPSSPTKTDPSTIMFMNDGRPNPNESSSSQSRPDVNQPQAGAKNWPYHNHEGDGFRVENGRLYINFSSDVSFYDKNNLPNKSPESRMMAENIANAFEYKYKYTAKNSTHLTNLNGCAQTWIRDYMKYTYPDRLPQNYINSGVFRNTLRYFARN